MRRAFFLGLLIAHTIFVPTAALGAEPTAAERALQLSDEAVAFYNARDYRHAIEKYAAAYALDPDPNLLFNQGRCYEALGDLPAADERYREFLSKPNGDVIARKKANDFVARFAASGAGKPKPASTAQAPPPPRPAEASEPRGGTMRAVGLGLAGAGLVTAGAGAYFFFKGRSDVNDVRSGNYGRAAEDPNAVSSLTEAEANQKIDDGKSRQTLGGILMGAGAGVTLLGAGLYLFAPSKRAAPTTALGGWALPGGGVLSLQGRF